MGHCIQSTEPFFENPQNSGFIIFGEAKQRNKRFVCDEESFQVAIKKPKQEGQNEILSVRGENLDEETLMEESQDSSSSYSGEYENTPHKFAFYKYPPRKIIPIGLNHQAEIANYTPQNSTTFEDSDKWIQTCVLQPDKISEIELEYIENNIKCGCEDIRSIECIRTHVKEAKKYLKGKLGFERFRELGFAKMGEEVALQWSEEEEKIFSQVVRFNPASYGKNFWTILPLAFPNKCMRDFVSYYFNVFMLRKRAVQNRSYLLYIDSEDDEWYESQGEEEEEEGMSGLESPNNNNSNCYYNRNSDLGLVLEEANMEVDERKVHQNESENACDDLKGKVDERRELGLDMQDESCTSFESGQIEKFDMEWEIGFQHNGKRKDELLPTCNVIEEVFGKEGSFDDK